MPATDQRSQLEQVPPPTAQTCDIRSQPVGGDGLNVFAGTVIDRRQYVVV